MTQPTDRAFQLLEIDKHRLDEELNKRSIYKPGRLSVENAGLAIWTLPAAEAAQIAFECAALMER